MALSAEAERLKALQEQERGEGVHACAEVAQDDFAADHRVGCLTEGGAEDASVVAWRGFGEGGKPRGCGPVELSCWVRAM